MVERVQEPLVLPNFIYKIWFSRIKDKVEINVDYDVLQILIKTYYTRSTWKWQRAYNSIKKIFNEKGFNEKESEEYTKMIIKVFDNYGTKYRTEELVEDFEEI